MTSLYSHDIILVLFQWVIKQDYKKKKKSLETGASLYLPKILGQGSLLCQTEGIQPREVPVMYVWANSVNSDQTV